MGRPTMRLAFLVIDLQIQFSDVVESPVLQKLNNLASFLRSRGVPIVYTQHGHPDPPAEQDIDVLVGFLGADNSIKCALMAAGLQCCMRKRTSTPVPRGTLPKLGT